MLIRTGTLSGGTALIDTLLARFRSSEYVRTGPRKKQSVVYIYLFFKDDPHGRFFLFTAQALGQQHIPTRFSRNQGRI